MKWVWFFLYRFYNNSLLQMLQSIPKVKKRRPNHGGICKFQWLSSLWTFKNKRIEFVQPMIDEVLKYFVSRIWSLQPTTLKITIDVGRSPAYHKNHWGTIHHLHLLGKESIEKNHILTSLGDIAPIISYCYSTRCFGVFYCETLQIYCSKLKKIKFSNIR